MSETNFPSPTAKVATGKSYKNAIIGVLAAGLIAVSAFALFNNKQKEQTVQQQAVQIEKVGAEKTDIQSSFDASLARLDSMSSVNTGLESKLTEKNNRSEEHTSELQSR